MFCFTLLSFYLGFCLGGGENPFLQAELAIDTGKYELAEGFRAKVAELPPSPTRDCQLAYLDASKAFHQGDPAQALEFLEPLESKFDSVPDADLKAKLFHRDGYLLLMAGQAKKADVQLNKALAIKKTLKEPLSQVKTLHALSDCARQLGKPDAVLKFSQEALDLTSKKFGENHVETGFERGFMTEAYLAVNQPKKAEELVSLNRDLMHTDAVKKDPRYTEYLKQVAKVASKNGNYSSAFFVLDDVQEREKLAFGELDLRRIPILLQQGDLAFLMEESWRAEGTFREVIKILESAHQSGVADMARALYGLGMIYKEWNNLSEARAMFERAQPIAQKYRDKFPALVIEIEKELASLNSKP